MVDVRVWWDRSPAYDCLIVATVAATVLIPSVQWLTELVVGGWGGPTVPQCHTGTMGNTGKSD